jgi:predicted DNA-binding transcriptional regulator AlpA
MPSKRDRLTVNEVGALLNVTASTIRSYVARNQMPGPSACPCCGSSSWDRSEVVAWNQARQGRTGRPRKAS